MPMLNAGRRRILRSGAGAVAAWTALPATWAQTVRGSSRVPMVAQIVDVSMLQQDVSKDFLIGSRAAWQDINSRASQRGGRTVQHLAIETDGSPASLRAALAQVRDNPACVALSGTVAAVTASLPVVRAYREVLGRLFDEPPSPLSLAGFLAARYTSEVLDEVNGPLTRSSVLTAFQKRAAMDIGGFRISFNPQRFGSTYVTQSMLTTDGRVIG